MTPFPEWIMVSMAGAGAGCALLLACTAVLLRRQSGVLARVTKERDSMTGLYVAARGETARTVELLKMGEAERRTLALGHDNAVQQLKDQGVRMDEVLAELDGVIAERDRAATFLRGPWYQAIANERARQDAQWGGPAHDDEHSLGDWADYVERQLADVRVGLSSSMIKVAALAVAALESQERIRDRDESNAAAVK